MIAHPYILETLNTGEVSGDWVFRFVAAPVPKAASIIVTINGDFELEYSENLGGLLLYYIFQNVKPNSQIQLSSSVPIGEYAFSFAEV